MTTKRRKLPTRPFGDLVGPVESFDEVCDRLRAGFVTPSVLRRTVAGLVAYLQSIAKPDCLTPGISPEERAQAKGALDLIVKVYREAKEGRIRT